MADKQLLDLALKRTPQQIMDTAVDEAQERIKLKDEIAELKYDKTMLEHENETLKYQIAELELTVNKQEHSIKKLLYSVAMLSSLAV